MLQLFILVICITSLNTLEADDDEGWDLDCILPPQPKNGHYKIVDGENSTSKPGDRLNKFILEVTCDPGYNVNNDNDNYTCLDGWSSSDYMLECLPSCSEMEPGVLSCGIGRENEVSRCLVPDQLLQEIGSRTGQSNDDLDCGSMEPVFVKIIAGGRSAARDELPWHAGIYTKTRRPYMQICGGSLVSTTVVISAAHCFWSDLGKLRPASNYAVAVGKLYRPWSDQNDRHVQRSDVAEIKVPPRFQGFTTNMQDDIAVVIVATPFVYGHAVTPVCLDFDIDFDNKQLRDGNLGKVAGWGLTSEDGRESPVLKVVEMPVVDISRCIAGSDPGFLSHITSDKICAGYQNGTSVCKGDSGGGLAFPESVHGSARYYLRGVVSAAPRSDHLCNTLAWATFTSVVRHEHFIRSAFPATKPVERASKSQSLPLHT